MNNIIYIISIFALMLLISCNQINNKIQHNQIIECEFSEKNFLRLSDIAESIEIIPLETNHQCYIEKISKIVKYENLYYIGDASMRTKRIVVFNEKGDLVYKLDKRGQGPDEYIEIRDFEIIDNARIAIISNSNPRLYIYDILKDTCLLHKNIDIYPDRLIVSDNNFYITKNGFKYKETEVNNLIRIYDIEGNFIKSLFYLDDLTLKTNSNIFPAITVSKSENNLYFTYPFCDTIFKIDKKENISPKFIYDFGNRSINKAELNKTKNALDIQKTIYDNNWIYAITYYKIENNLIYTAFYDFNFKGYMSFYNINNNKNSIAHYIIDDIYFTGNKILLNPLELPRFMNNGYLYSSLEPTKLKKWYNKYKTRVTKQEWEVFCNKHSHLIQVMNNLKEDDNPLIMKIKLKDEI